MAQQLRIPIDDEPEGHFLHKSKPPTRGLKRMAGKSCLFDGPSSPAFSNTETAEKKVYVPVYKRDMSSTPHDPGADPFEFPTTPKQKCSVFKSSFRRRILSEATFQSPTSSNSRAYDGSENSKNLNTTSHTPENTSRLSTIARKTVYSPHPAARKNDSTSRSTNPPSLSRYASSPAFRPISQRTKDLVRRMSKSELSSSFRGKPVVVKPELLTQIPTESSDTAKTPTESSAVSLIRKWSFQNLRQTPDRMRRQSSDSHLESPLPSRAKRKRSISTSEIKLRSSKPRERDYRSASPTASIRLRSRQNSLVEMNDQTAAAEDCTLLNPKTHSFPSTRFRPTSERIQRIIKGNETDFERTGHREPPVGLSTEDNRGCISSVTENEEAKRCSPRMCTDDSISNSFSSSLQSDIDEDWRVSLQPLTRKTPDGVHDSIPKDEGQSSSPVHVQEGRSISSVDYLNNSLSDLNASESSFDVTVIPEYAIPSSNRLTAACDVCVPSASEPELTPDNRLSPLSPKRQSQAKQSKAVKFQEISVYYFERCQGIGTVPKEGEICLGMENKHFYVKKFDLKSGKLPVILPSVLPDHQNNDLEEDEVTGFEDELYYNRLTPDVVYYPPDEEPYTSYSISVLPENARVLLLRQSGVDVQKGISLPPISRIRMGRLKCGCSCKYYCDENCYCARNGIECQFDGYEEDTMTSYPCGRGCSQGTCRNPYGRHAFDVEYNFDYRRKTLQRLALEERMELTKSATRTIYNEDGEAEQSFERTSSSILDVSFERAKRFNELLERERMLEGESFCRSSNILEIENAASVDQSPEKSQTKSEIRSPIPSFLTNPVPRSFLSSAPTEGQAKDLIHDGCGGPTY